VTKLLLLAAAVIQAAVALITFIQPLYGRLAGWQERTSLDRSARLTYGDDFANYIAFLQATIPAQSTVILPPFSENQVFGHVGFMQYFLFPRNLVICPSETSWDSCLSKVNSPTTYILALDGFPPAVDARYMKVLVRFGPDRGVYVPVWPGSASP
jgi:hypothetical protein